MTVVICSRTLLFLHAGIQFKSCYGHFSALRVTDNAHLVVYTSHVLHGPIHPCTIIVLTMIVDFFVRLVSSSFAHHIAAYIITLLFGFAPLEICLHSLFIFSQASPLEVLYTFPSSPC